MFEVGSWKLEVGSSRLEVSGEGCGGKRGTADYYDCYDHKDHNNLRSLPFTFNLQPPTSNIQPPTPNRNFELQTVFVNFMYEALSNILLNCRNGNEGDSGL
jgi:hypothetical protein